MGQQKEEQITDIIYFEMFHYFCEASDPPTTSSNNTDGGWDDLLTYNSAESGLVAVKSNIEIFLNQKDDNYVGELWNGANQVAFTVKKGIVITNDTDDSEQEYKKEYFIIEGLQALKISTFWMSDWALRMKIFRRLRVSANEPCGSQRQLYSGRSPTLCI